MIATESAILTGQYAYSTPADNATSTATIPAGQGQQSYRNYVVGFIARYSAAVAATKNITINYTDLGDATHEGGTARSLVVPWDFTNGAAIIALPGVIACRVNTAVTVVLDASGAGGTTGTLEVAFFTR